MIPPAALNTTPVPCLHKGRIHFPVPHLAEALSLLCPALIEAQEA